MSSFLLDLSVYMPVYLLEREIQWIPVSAYLQTA